METAATLERAAGALLCCAESFIDAHIPDQIDGAVGVLTNTISRLEAHRLRLLTQRGIADRSTLSAELNLARNEAAQLETLIERLAPLAPLQAAAEAGTVSMSKARMIANAITNERASAAQRDAGALTAFAANLPPNRLARQLEQWTRTVDDERGVDTNETLRAKRSLETHRRRTGMTEIIATLDPESAEIVATALDTRTQDEWRNEIPEQHPERTAAQRRADALTGICHDWLTTNSSAQAPSTSQNTPTGHSNSTAANMSGSHTPNNAATSAKAPSRSRPHISVIINIDNLTSNTGHGTTERGTPLTAQAIRRIACDAAISPIFTNARSEIIDVGRQQRTFNGAIRKTLVLRDQGCRHPSCTAPPSWTEGHHITHWANGGQTTTANGCLLCHRHHHAAHEGGWTITGNANHQLTFTAPNGTRLPSDPPGPITQAA